MTSTTTSTSGLHASLHPLVLLTISDYITRHTLRNSRIPLVGALLGQQKGREITIEHAYDVKLNISNNSYSLDEAFFAERLQQYKDVHKEPVLDLVGWWSAGRGSDLDPSLLPIHKHVLHQYNENGLFLVFHPEATAQRAFQQAQTAGNKLPLTIFETVWDTSKGDGDEDAIMQDDGQIKNETEATPRVLELPYEVVTGEAEMIAMDFVAKGSGNATAVPTSTTEDKTEATSSKGKSKSKEPDQPKKETSALNAQEEELISFLTTRANAIKMLQSRISQLSTYLSTLPPSYLTDSNLPISSDPSQQQQPSHPLLRSILALTSRLPHLLPSDISTFLSEQSAEQADVAIVSLLGSLGRSTIDAKELGRTFSVAESARTAGRKGRGGRVEMMDSHFGGQGGGFGNGFDPMMSAYGEDDEGADSGFGGRR